MAVINLRGVPDNLAEQLKTEAVWAGMGFHEYCLAILERREDYRISVLREEKEKRVGKIISPLFRLGPEETDGHGNVVPGKKIADISAGGVAQEDGGDPGLPAGGKAQDGHKCCGFENVTIRGDGGVFDVIACGCDCHVVKPFLYERSGNAPDFDEVIIPSKFPQWSPEFLKKVATEEPGGLMACSPEILGEMLEQAKIDGGVAATLHLAGIKLDREILVRWGLAENYTPKMGDFNKEFPHTMEETFGSEKELLEASVRAAGASTGRDRQNNKANAEGSDVDEAGAVGVGKPKVDMAALRDICAGNISVRVKDFMSLVDALDSERHEVDLCGFESYNDIDGENYVCGKEKHGPKVKHGEWIKI